MTPRPYINFFLAKLIWFLRKCSNCLATIPVGQLREVRESDGKKLIIERKSCLLVATKVMYLKYNYKTQMNLPLFLLLDRLGSPENFCNFAKTSHFSRRFFIHIFMGKRSTKFQFPCVLHWWVCPKSLINVKWENDQFWLLNVFFGSK